jgi:Protein of unknown function (DUF1592)/Protein of unknown function (DUF1588)/Protein of unknown function (DUF1595)/Protein of unknown function (DUF1587)/Protein of unknown function (DUF1585)
MARQKFLSLATLVVTASLGCHGTIGDGSEEPGGPGPTKPGPGPGPGPMGAGGDTGAGNRGGTVGPGGSTGMNPPPMGDPLAAGVMPLRRLTIREYNNTLRDLLGDTANRASAFPADKDSEFLFHRAQVVSSTDADSLKDAAEGAAAALAAKITQLAPCVGMAEDACARKFVVDFGLRAYRRPVEVDEGNRLMALYTTGRTTLGLDYQGTIQLMIEAMLQSPAFLYHWELGNGLPIVEGKVVRLGPYETASRLSYLIWGSMPDAMLFDAAKANALATADQVQNQAKRMLGDQRARDTVGGFAEEWLNLDQISERPKDTMVYPEWNDALKAAMTAELKSFISNVVFDGDGRFTSLLMGTNSYVNQPLAAVYGVRGITGTAMTPAMLDANQRAGLLTRAGFLAVTGATNGSHPIKRGHKINERLLCGTLPPPPNNVPPAKPPTASGTTRQHVEEHDQMPCAVACHSIMDPIGFAFEHYDGIGRYRDQDNNLPIDSTGSIELDGGKKDFSDAKSLSQVLSASNDVAQCFATMWLRFAFKRNDSAADLSSLEAMDTAFAKANSVKDLLVGLVGTRSFRYRTPGTGEKLQ